MQVGANFDVTGGIAVPSKSLSEIRLSFLIISMNVGRLFGSYCAELRIC